MRQLDEEAARRRAVAPSEDPYVAFRGSPRTGPIADPQAPRDLTVTAAGQGDDAVVIRLEQLVTETRHGLGPREVRPGDDPTQAAPADGGPGEEYEMRPPRPFADATIVLLDGVAMARELRPRRPGPDRPALGGEEHVLGRRLATPPSTTWRDDDRIGIGDRRVAQLDLGPDDPVESRFRGGAHEPDRTVQTVAVGDGERTEIPGHGPLDQVIRGGGTVEEREVGVGVELGVGDRRHVGRLVPGAGGG